MAKKKKLTRHETKFRFLEYLFNEEDFVNENVILHGAYIYGIHSQDYTIAKGYLEELCDLGFLDKKEKKTAGTRVNLEYKITEEGRNFVDDPRIKKFFGVTND